jgi:hypothetical protein
VEKAAAGDGAVGVVAGEAATGEAATGEAATGEVVVDCGAVAGGATGTVCAQSGVVQTRLSSEGARKEKRDFMDGSSA